MLKLHVFKDVKFWHREGFSDLKTFKEVYEGRTYERKNFKLLKGEKWLDCGGNVGAFTLFAAKKGAFVTVYEPDPFNCKMIEKNLKENNLDANIKCKALVHDDSRFSNLFIGNNNNVWRNSIVKNWNGKGIRVECENFEKASQGIDCCKMDIEGAEMLILENTRKVFKKLVYEWSFDIDPSLERLWRVLDRQINHYERLIIPSSTRYKQRDFSCWQKSWFPACVNIFCERS